MSIETIVYKTNQTIIPAEIRKKYNVQVGDVVEWEETREGNILIKFRKKVSVEEMVGSIKLDEETTSAELVKNIYE